MNVRKPHKIWIEQCEATQTIKARFGLTAAFDYLVGEKLMSFASAASRHPDFARELPRFVSEVRRMFTPDEIGAQLAQIERSQNERNVDVLEEEDDLLREGHEQRCELSVPRRRPVLWRRPRHFPRRGRGLCVQSTGAVAVCSRRLQPVCHMSKKTS